MTEEMKDKIAKRNELGEQRYRDKVIEDIGNEMKPEDELAIHRKAIALLFEIISTLHPDEINNEEFAKYHNRIEEIKNKHEVLKS